MNWTIITHRYAQTCQIGYYAAQADVEARRKANGDDEAARWFGCYINGERIAWNDKA